MIRVAVLDDYQRVSTTFADWGRLGPEVAVTVFDRHLADAEAPTALQGFDVLCLMRERQPLRRALIEALPDLRLVVFTGARTHSIDVEAAAERGIVVCHTRGGESEFATSELALGLILACARSIPQEAGRMREGGWQETVGTVLHGKTLGILGLGKLGRRMAVLGGALGMPVLAWSPHLTAERAAAAGAELVGKDDLFRRADVLTIHMVLSEATRGLVGPHELGLMKPSAILVNTSRGPLVDEAALIEALRTERIAVAGLDVFDREPLPAEHPLRALPNAVLTPHLGYVTEGTYRAFFEDTVEAIAAWRAGAPVRVFAGNA